ncbi:hypothetical protein CORC01_10355 [Colletotrichum orchidophilum]|uniref:Chitin-binding type-1 domain-containing protein n=1 Tax=Colletotrichum orchidophilum TaxID=1209926 RepID=A0A1G4AYR3_9PEZI|nr:uncharacterized protein CORC01_10355 [Colletotrichum orchidophilum]OHE94308.1 hypothetical protein CORC01_10355 [Colletotrichum orchidophilum]
MMGRLCQSTTSLIVAAHLLSLVSLGKAADECQPYTWSKAGMPTVVVGELPRATPTLIQEQALSERAEGDVVCRAWDTTEYEVNYYSCKEMADFWFADIDFFFTLNPGLERDCSNIQPNTEYCTDGWIEPLRDPEGRCGPQFGNASCAYGSLPCCNSQTWKCGETYEDCAPGTCYEGLCPGDAVWSSDGTCGTGHGNRQCAGKWGDCCNQDGRCGTGPDFCGKDVCQMGNCTVPLVPVPSSSVSVSFPPVTEPFAQSTTATSLSPSSTSTAPASPACTAGSNAQGIPYNFKGLCSSRCDLNHCPAGVCVSTGPAAEPAAIPELTDCHGCPDDEVAGGGNHAYYVDLCEFTCSHGSCPAGACKCC